MTTAKRQKICYAGVILNVARLDRYGEERMSYIQYRWGGRGAKEIEESVGRESESIAASRRNDIRTMRTAGIEQADTERRRRRRSAHR